MVITGQIKGIKGADGRELDIRAQVNVTITAAAGSTLAVALDRTQGVYISVGGTTTLVATVGGYTSDARLRGKPRTRKLRQSMKKAS